MRRDPTHLTAGLGLLALLLGAAPCGAPESEALEGPAAEEVRAALDSGTARFDHARWDSLARAGVEGDLVDYRAFQRRRGTLEAYLERVASADLASLSGPHLKAFLLNAYNAYTVRTILEHPSVESIREIDGVFDGITHRVGGHEVTLDEIEHGLLRPYFRDPRIHFAVNCASLSCAPLPPWAFTGEGLDAQLERVTRAFLRDTANVRVEDGRLLLSRYFDWYGGDFTAEGWSPRAETVPLFVAEYGTEEVGAFVREHGGEPPVRFLEYDWSLNAAVRPTTESEASGGSLRSLTVLRTVGSLREPPVGFTLAGPGTSSAPHRRLRVVGSLHEAPGAVTGSGQREPPVGFASAVGAPRDPSGPSRGAPAPVGFAVHRSGLQGSHTAAFGLPGESRSEPTTRTAVSERRDSPGARSAVQEGEEPTSGAGWVAELRRWVDSLGLLGFLAYGAVYVLATVLMVPGSALTIGAGVAFGLLWGTVLVSVASVTGAALAFLLGRYLLRERVSSWIEGRRKFEIVDRAVGEKDWKIVALTRLSPVFPFNVQNYAYGLTRVSFRGYVLASWAAMLPATVLYVWIGVAGAEAVEAATGAADWGRTALQGLGVLATLGVAVMAGRIATRALKEAAGEEIVEEESEGEGPGATGAKGLGEEALP